MKKSGGSFSPEREMAPGRFSFLYLCLLLSFFFFLIRLSSVSLGKKNCV